MTAVEKPRRTQVLSEALGRMRGSPIFAFYTLVTLVVAAFIGLMVAQMALNVDVFLPGLFAEMSHGAPGPHRVHDLMFAFLIAAGVAGIAAQLGRPSKNVAGMLLALIPFAALLLVGLLSAQYEVMVRRNPARLIAAVAVVTALVHPSGRRFFHSIRASGVNSTMLGLVAVAALPLLGFASTNIDVQSGVIDEHSVQGHYGFMAAFAITLLAVGLVASLRPDGWRLTAWVTGLLAILMGATSLLYQDASSSLDANWALAAIGWGGVFIATAESGEDVQGPGLLVSRRHRAGSARSS